MCSYWPMCKYPFSGDINQFLSNMIPGVHGVLLSLTVASIYLNRHCKLPHKTRVSERSSANISARYTKFPGVYSPEFLHTLSLLRSSVSVLLPRTVNARRVKANNYFRHRLEFFSTSIWWTLSIVASIFGIFFPLNVKIASLI